MGGGGVVARGVFSRDHKIEFCISRLLKISMEGFSNNCLKFIRFFDFGNVLIH